MVPLSYSGGINESLEELEMIESANRQPVRRLRVFILCLLLFTTSGSFCGIVWAAGTDSDHVSQTATLVAQANDSFVQDADDLDDLEDWSDIEESADVYDPLESFNRFMFTFNDKLYFYGIKPVATVYSHVMPMPLRISINNGWQNLATPVRVANCLLQLKLKGAGIEIARFFINSIMGIGGLGDPAERMFGLHRQDEDLGQTFATWGVGFGPYLVLPFIGPSCPRDAMGMLGDSYLYPLNYYIGEFWQGAAIRVGKEINLRSLQLGEYENFKASALDPYVAVRSAYYQYRKSSVEYSTDRFKSFTIQ